MSVNSTPMMITTDSRAVKPGCTFVAIQGDLHDGHSFIPQAIQKGATEIVAEKSKLTSELRAAIPQSVKLHEVESSLIEIRARAHAYRKQFKIPFVAIVGAVGKTTTKELIAAILQGKFSPEEIMKTEGSQNGFLGIPITLFTISEKTKIAVIEIGIDDLGAMEQHLALVEPTHFILTAIGPEHLHQLKTVEQAASEELKAFDYALARALPMAINLSDEYVLRWKEANESAIEKLKSRNLVFTYSLSNQNYPSFLGNYSMSKNTLTIAHDQQSVELPLPLPGEHHAHNLLAAVTISQFFELSRDQIKKGLSSFKTAYGRTEILNLKNGALVIGDYYNSNPTSAAAAIKLLREKSTHGGKTFAILGDMLELGELEEKFHRDLLFPITKEGINEVLLYGPRMKWLQDEFKKQNTEIKCEHFETHDAIISALKTKISKKDTVLIKGSRGMKMETILKALQ